MSIFHQLLEKLGTWKQDQEQMIKGLSEKLLVKHVAYPDEVAEAYVFLMK